MRLGCAVRVYGQPGLKAYDTRRWQHEPHLSVSLMYLRDILTYLHRRHILFYRMAAEVLPFAAYPNQPEYRRQIDECAQELAHVGALARRYGIRLTVHAPAYVSLSSEDPDIVRRSQEVLAALAEVLTAMTLPPESVIVVHVGGGYGARDLALDRFCRHVEALPPEVRQRLALEHDDTTFDLADVLYVHRRTGLPVVFDLLHHRLLNRSGIPLREAVEQALATWPPGVTPKVHLASPSTAMRVVERRNPVTGRRYTTVHPPLWNQHSDFIHPYDAIALLTLLDGLDVDVMVEARAGDVAVVRLCQDLWRFAPELATGLAQRPPRYAAEPMPLYPDWVEMPEEDDDGRVLVVVMNNPRDFAIARDEGWYRIPVQRAPRQVAADYLAFYLTRVFEEERWTIPYIAPVLRYRVVRRVDLLPEEADHPRAQEWYYKVEIGPIRRLPRPIPSRRFRRVTFIPTTLQRLLNAEELNDLWMSSEVQAQLHAALKERHVHAEQQYVVAEGGSPYRADLAIPCLDGGVAVRFQPLAADRPPLLTEQGWAVLYLDPQEVLAHMEEALESILDEVREHGGERHVTPMPAL